VSRRQPQDPLEERGRGVDPLELRDEGIGDAPLVEDPRRTEGEQIRDVRGVEDPAVRETVVERLHPERVARDEDPPARPVRHDEGEVPR
jgi:hypothetical protein